MGSSYLALGYACNHQCICCPLTTYDRLHAPLSYEDIKARIELIERCGEDEEHSGPPHIVLSGGEPMLHKDLLKVVELVLQKGFTVAILSNASLCRDEKLVQTLQDVMDPTRSQVITAIHSSTPAIHDSITGVPGSLLDSLTGLDHLLAAGIPITIKHIFNKISLPTLMETFTYLEEHYPPNVGFQFCTMDYSGKAGKNVEALFVTMEDIRPSFESVLDYLEGRMSHKRKISIIESPLCMVDPYYWKYYNTAPDDLTAYVAPNTDDAKALYDVGSACGAFYAPCDLCAVQKWCPGTWISAYKYHAEGLLSPILNNSNT